MARPELRGAFGACAARLQVDQHRLPRRRAGLLVMAGRLGDRYGTCGCSASA
ncbi:hypothetical protein ACFY7B_29425 [Streptomyces albidoflavus]